MMRLTDIRCGQLEAVRFSWCPLPHTALGLMLVLLFVGCSKSVPKADLKPPTVTVVSAMEEEITDYDELVGRTEASETVEVRSRVSGYIKEIHFKDGDRVQKDQPLFNIEPDLYQAIHQQSLSRIDLGTARKDLAQSKLNRSKTLIAVNAISKEEFEESEASLKEAEAQIVAARADADRTALDLKYTQIRAEIDGRIDRALITPGNMVTGGIGNGTLLTRIVRNDPIYAYVDVDERSVLRYLRRANASSSDADKSTKSLRERQIPCSMQLADEKDFPHEGVLDFVENRVNVATGSIQIRGAFRNENQFLTGGLFVRIRVPVSEPYKAVLVPEQSIGVDQGAKFVYVVGDDKIPIRREIVPGPQRGNLRVIKSGINAGESVIYRGVQRVRPGKPVTVEKAAFPSSSLNPSAKSGLDQNATDANRDVTTAAPKSKQ
jgi:RND family efflux transporter MFP subunit